MQRVIKILSFCFCIIFYNITQAQCTVTVDVANLDHIDCPNGGAVGGASILSPHYYQNYSWQNFTNGQTYNGGGGYGGTSRNDLDAGFYEITASSPYNSSCPAVAYSALFEILEAEPDFQFNPTQACPSLCNVSVTASMQIAIPGVSYTYQFDANPVVILPNSLTNQCGGLHTYEIFADGTGCGAESIGISQFAQMNLATSVTNITCTQSGSATVNITGVGASALNNYCVSGPNSLYNFHQYSAITNVNLIGNTSVISNNTSCPNTEYFDFTSFSADVTPGNTYDLILDLGTCNFGGPGGSAMYLIDIAKVYIDWNIDGDFNDANELVGQVSPTLSPSTTTLPITVPIGAIPGQSRMRIVAQNYMSQNTNQALACDYQSAWWGETEDYTIVVTGSVANPVTYLWSDGQTTPTATNLSSGTHTVTITDANGCTANASATISGSNNISVTASSDQTICNGYAPSSLNASNSGGAGTYSWADASNPSVILGTTSNFSPPPLTTTTTYIVTFTDASSGCTGVDVVVITVNSFFSFITSVSPTCFGDIDGSITISTTGGNNAFQYTLYWLNPISGFWVQLAQTSSYLSTPQLFPNLLAGDYWIQVDNQICLVNDEYLTLTEPPEVIITAAANQTICNGDTPAPLTSSASSSGSNYSWSPPNDFVNANVQNPSFSNGISNNTTYTVTFIDVDGCIANDDVIITVNPIPTVTLNASPNPVCVGNNITLTATPSAGSTYRFQYNDGGGWTNLTSPAWSSVNPQTFLNILSTTDFRVKVREANSCIPSSWSPIITVPITSITTGVTPNPALLRICQNSSPSNLTVIANGGIVPYQYHWYEYSSPQQASGAVIIPNEIDSFLIPPTNIVGVSYYYCIVTGQGCEDTSAIITVETVSPPIFTLQPQDSAVCIGSNLTINIEDTFSVTVGGNAIVPVYQWYENSICDTTVSGGSVPAAGPGNNTNTYTPQTTTAGTTYYYCTVVIPQIDGCNTIISECAEIIVNPIPTVTLSAAPTTACVGDDIVLTALPSMPVNLYKFQYNTGSGWINMSAPAFDIINPITFSNISTTTQFRVQALEYNGCINSSWSPTIAVTANWLPSQTTATSQTACLGGVVTDLFAVGSLPTWYSDQALTTQVYQGNYYATGQTAVGLYTYYVTETWNGCEGLAVPVTLEIYAIPSAPTATNDVACEGGVIPDLTATGIFLLWYDDAALTSQVGTGASFATMQTAAGVYTYYVTQDDGNCESNAQMVTLTIYALPPPPSAGNETACEGGVIPDLTATGTSLLWYDDAVLTSQVGTGASFATMQTVAGVYTYYVTQNAGNCESNAQMVTLEIYAIPVTPPIWHN